MIINALLALLIILHAFLAINAGLPLSWPSWIVLLPAIAAGAILLHRARQPGARPSPMLLTVSLAIADVVLVPSIPFQSTAWLIGLFAVQFFAAAYVIARLAKATIAQASLAVLSSELTLLALGVTLPSLMPMSTGEVVTDVFYAGGPIPDDTLTYRYLPRSIFRHYYPDNENHEFNELSAEIVEAMNGWRMDGSPPNANLTFGHDPRPIARVDFDPSATETATISRGPYELPERRSGSIRFFIRSAKSGIVEVSFHPEEPSAASTLTYRFSVDAKGRWHEWIFDSSAGRTKGRFRFTCDVRTEWIEISEWSVSDQPDLSPIFVEPPTVTPYYTEYRLNDAGFRDVNWAVPHSDRTRIICVGDSYTMGFGVDASDTFCRQLDRRLNRNGTRFDYELVNLGHPGYSTREERKLYEKWAPTLGGDIVLLTVVWNDDLPFVEEVALRQKEWEKRGKRGSIFDLPRPRGNYQRCTDEILALDRSCRSRNANLVVVLFREEETEGDWDELARLITENLAGTKISICDLAPVLKQHRPESLRVHRADAHPNALAHRLAAEAIEKFLIANALIRREN